MTKVLSFIINFVPYHVARWNAAASSENLDVTVAQLRANDEFKVLESTSHNNNSKFSLVTLEDKFASRDHWQLLRKVREIIDAKTPDVIVIAGYSFPVSLAALTVAREQAIPVIICSESNSDDAHRVRLIEKAKKVVIRQCSAGLAGADRQRNYLVQLGFDKDAVFTGYNAVDNPHFASALASSVARLAELRKVYALPDRFFLSVGRFTHKKNHKGLIDAFHRARSTCLKKGNSVPDLVIAGDGDLRAELECLISKLDLGSSVHLIGAVGYDDLPGVYALADALIHPSTVEQWGLVVNEGMAACLPVLVSRTCGCADSLVQHKSNGLTFNPHDPDDISAAMQWMSQRTPDEAKKLGETSAEIISNWGPENFKLGLEKAVSKALTTIPPKRRPFDLAMLRILIMRGEIHKR